MTIQECVRIALQHQHAGRLAEAEKLYRQILAEYPDQPDALFLLGTLAEQVGQRDLAMALVAKAISILPTHADFHGRMGLLLAAGGRKEEAIASFKRAIELNPNVADVHSNLGVAYSEQGKPHMALPCFERALQLEPQHMGALNNVGSVLCELKRYEEAAVISERAVRLWPDRVQLHTNLGYSLTKLQRLEQGAAVLRNAVNLRPEPLSSQMYLAQALVLIGLYNESLVCYCRVIAAGPNPQQLEAYIKLNEAILLRDKQCPPPSPVAAGEAHEQPAKLPYLGDKVVLLQCPRPVREQLRQAGLHSGYAIDPSDGAEIWIKVQLATNRDPANLPAILGRWLNWIRNEAAMSDTTCTVWMPQMPPAVAQVIRDLAGADLIEVSGDNASDITQTLAAHAVTPNQSQDQIFALVSIRNGGVALLPHWLEHYTRLGVDEILIGIYDDLTAQTLHEIDQYAQRWKFRRFSQHWNDATETEQYTQRETGCRLAGARPGTWIMHTDLDELHEYPAPIREITAAAAEKQMNAVYGSFVDRVTADGSLPPIRPEPSLWEQFPLECKVTDVILKGWPQKVMLARYNLRVKSGHHETVMEAATPPPLGEPADYRVAHFKWHGDLLARMRWGVRQPNASAEWKADAHRFLSWISRNNDRLDLSDPALQAQQAIRRQ